MGVCVYERQRERRCVYERERKRGEEKQREEREVGKESGAGRERRRSASEKRVHHCAVVICVWAQAQLLRRDCSSTLAQHRPGQRGKRGDRWGHTRVFIRTIPRPERSVGVRHKGRKDPEAVLFSPCRGGYGGRVSMDVFFVCCFFFFQGEAVLTLSAHQMHLNQVSQSQCVCTQS